MIPKPIAITATLIFVLQPNFALSENLPKVRRNVPMSARTLNSAQPGRAGCAAFGSGFVAIAGSSTCVHITGHVRVGYSWGANRGGGMRDTIVPPSDDQADPAPPYDRLRPSGFGADKGQGKTTWGRSRKHAVPVQFAN